MNACCSLRWLNGFVTLTLSVFVLVWKHLFSGSLADTFLQFSAYITWANISSGQELGWHPLTFQYAYQTLYRINFLHPRSETQIIKTLVFEQPTISSTAAKKKQFVFFILSTHCNIKNISSQLIKKQTTLFFTEWGKTKHFISY